MLDIIIEKHGSKTDRELGLAVLYELFLLNQKIDSFMSQTTDLLQKISDDVTGISDDVASIGQEITDLKAQVAAGQDSQATIDALTALEQKTSAAKTALDALVPAPATPPVDTPGAAA